MCHNNFGCDRLKRVFLKDDFNVILTSFENGIQTQLGACIRSNQCWRTKVDQRRHDPEIYRS